MTTQTVLPKDLPIPKNAGELAEFFGDGGRYKEIFTSKDRLQEFVQTYADNQQADGTDLNRQVAEHVNREFAALLRSGGLADLGNNAAGESLRRLNMDPQTRGAGMLTQHKQGAAHNKKAAGAIMDGEFESLTDFAMHSWHMNPSTEVQSKMQRLRNAAGTVIPADGGFLVPEILRSQLLEIALEMSVVRPRATVVPMESSRVPFPVIDSVTNSGSVYGAMIAYWGEEGAALQDANPKFGRIDLDAKKLTGMSAVPNELFQDSIVSFAALLERLWPAALAFFEDVAFMTGTGAGEPRGFLNNTATVAVAKETGQAGSTILLENIIKMYSRMLPASLSTAVWIAAPNTIPELMTMALSVGTGGGPVMLTNVAGPAPVTIFGRPLIISEKAKTLGTQGDIAFVDLAYYLVGDRQAMTAASSTDYLFGSDKTTYRIIQRVDGQPWIKSAITPQNGAADTLSPFVELAVRA